MCLVVLSAACTSFYQGGIFSLSAVGPGGVWMQAVMGGQVRGDICALCHCTLAPAALCFRFSPRRLRRICALLTFGPLLRPQGVGGVTVAVLNVVTLLAYPDEPDKAAFVFFVVSLLVSGLCIGECCAVPARLQRGILTVVPSQPPLFAPRQRHRARVWLWGLLQAPSGCCWHCLSSSFIWAKSAKPSAVLL